MNKSKFLKPNLQLNFINVAVKLGLVGWGFMSHFDDVMSSGFFHFISLYGSISFLIIGFFEYSRKNYILALFAVIGLIGYQPVYSVLYDQFAGGSENDIDINLLVIQITVLAFIPWIIYDFVRWFRDYRKYKKQSTTTSFDDEEFKEYVGLVFKSTEGDFNAFSMELLDDVGERIKDQLPSLFKELGGQEQKEVRKLELMRKLYNNPKMTEVEMMEKIEMAKQLKAGKQKLSNDKN